MKWFRSFAFSAFAALLLAAAPARSSAQISISIGVAPACPYGYFNYPPYQCAPFGYYGPQWFTGGVFLGAGPWFRGPVGFQGYINHDYDPRFGYHGPFPVRGEHADWGRHRGWEHEFHGNEFHAEHHDNGNHYGQYKEHGDNGHGDHREAHGDRDNGRGHGHDDDRRDNDHGHGRNK